jgi:hypothetical protein
MFFCERTDESGFEEVDKFVFANRKFARNGEKPRYTENYVSVVDGEVEVVMKATTAPIMGHVARLLGAQVPSGRTDFCQEPTHIQFTKGRSVFQYELATQTKWKRA